MVMLCDIIVDIATSIVILLETILIELFSVVCVLAIDMWKAEEIIDVDDPLSTPTRDINNHRVENVRVLKEDESTTSSIESIGSQHSSDISAEYRHLRQKRAIQKRKSRAHHAEIVGSQIVFEQ